MEQERVPHWVLGREKEGLPVRWDGRAVDSWPLADPLGGPNSPRQYPWHVPSGQPNDCDGPDSEPCIMVGPRGAWFDFSCERKTRPGTTPGPEIAWAEGGDKVMYNVYPLCQVDAALFRARFAKADDEAQRAKEEL